eukprot:m.29215 g.29215  ORF g.29215 m.29215 type:complete len:123 (+) comp9141_c0_seq2:1875-2243(+)
MATGAGSEVDVEGFLQAYLQRLEGVQWIALTDREGVCAAKVGGEQLNPSVLTTATTACEQTSKIALGSSRVVITRFSNRQLVSYNLRPVFVHLLADSTANTGFLLDLFGELDEGLRPLKNVL